MREPHYEHWLTTHWPPLIDRPYVPSVYLQDQHKPGCRIGAGHKVLIYEYKYGPSVLDPQSGHRIRRHEGQEGIVLAVAVSTDFRERPADVAVQDYEGRVRTNWKWEALTQITDRGYVPRSEVNRVLRYKPRYNFVGFNHGKGYKGITPEQYAELLSLLKSEPDPS